MYVPRNLRGGLVALSVLLLAACASNETKPNEPADNATETTTASATARDAKASSSAPAAAPVAEIADPTYIAFDKMSVKLDDEGVKLVATLVDKAQNATKLEIWGFCDRAQIGNPKDCAVARAVAVKKALVDAGARLPKHRIRYNTEKPGAHAVEVRFD